jgi:hypothetical protein
MARCLFPSVRLLATLVTLLGLLAPPAALARPNTSPAATIVSTLPATNQMAMASRPDLPPTAPEIEAADDFILTAANQITNASFAGLLPTGQALTTVQDVVVEIYRVFPLDSTNPPSGHVPTRVNSPSDVAFVSRTASAGELTFTTTLLSASFTASNSVVNGIHPIPNQTTGGEGPVTGQEVQINVTFTPAFDLPADHYFFVPQVRLASGNFLWLSGQRPASFTPDLQAWIRNAALDPDWLRVGTDIVGGTTPPTFNGAFSLQGNVICTTRPTVGVTVAPSGSGRLQATLTANSNASTPGNRLIEIQFTRATGAVVQDTNGVAITAPSTTIPAPSPATFSFFVRKAVPNQAATVFLSVIDGCGSWTTLVGGGPTAFPPEPPPAGASILPAPTVTAVPTAAPSLAVAAAAVPPAAAALSSAAARQPAVATLPQAAAVQPAAAALSSAAPAQAPPPGAIIPVPPAAPASSGTGGGGPGRLGVLAGPGGPPAPWVLVPWAPAPWPPQMAPAVAPFGSAPGYYPAGPPGWPAWPQQPGPAPLDDGPSPSEP